MKLEEYTEIKEKEQFFVNGGSKINHNINKIFSEIEKYKTEENSFIFRGCSEAKYKLYSLCILNYANFNIVYISVKDESIDVLYCCQ